MEDFFEYDNAYLIRVGIVPKNGTEQQIQWKELRFQYNEDFYNNLDDGYDDE